MRKHAAKIRPNRVNGKLMRGLTRKEIALHLMRVRKEKESPPRRRK